MPNQAEPGAQEFLPSKLSLTALRTAAAECRGCDLWQHATQTVFGEGPARARVVFVGEQPGDQEDQEGHPFVGPAGRLLDRALSDAGIDRKIAYVTNIVKHFKFELRGKRRIHQKPTGREVFACQPWFEAELKVINPEVVVCLGATAAQAILGKQFRVTKEHGKWMESAEGYRVIATVHPSSILRALSKDREREYDLFVTDLRIVAAELKRS